ncbi:MAG: YdjY domain-containing protein [Isosphaerales bacterium]
MYAGLTLAFLLVQAAADDGGKPKAEAIQPDSAWKSLGRSLWFDRKTKRLVLRARVVLREGYLEHLMCSKGTKEHEAILATDAVPQQIHAGLLLTGAEPGHPVQFVPKFEPPTGSAIAIELLWSQDGKIHKSDARQWVKDEKNAPLARDWVFAGSQFYEDPTTKQQRYAADEGDLITVANFGSSILDLPIESSANDTERAFSTNTEKIPPLGTEVFLSFSPRPVKSNEKPGTRATRTP